MLGRLLWKFRRKRDWVLWWASNKAPRERWHLIWNFKAQLECIPKGRLHNSRCQILPQGTFSKFSCSFVSSKHLSALPLEEGSVRAGVCHLVFLWPLWLLSTTPSLPQLRRKHCRFDLTWKLDIFLKKYCHYLCDSLEWKLTAPCFFLLWPWGSHSLSWAIKNTIPNNQI